MILLDCNPESSSSNQLFQRDSTHAASKLIVSFPTLSMHELCHFPFHLASPVLILLEHINAIIKVHKQIISIIINLWGGGETSLSKKVCLNKRLPGQTSLSGTVKRRSSYESFSELVYDSIKLFRSERLPNCLAQKERCCQLT